MAWELQNLSTVSYSFKWEFSVADDVVLRGNRSQAPNYDNLTWFMITEKHIRWNDMLSHGLLGYVTEGSFLQTQRSPEAPGQAGEPQYSIQRKDPLPWLLPGLSPENINPTVWRWHPPRVNGSSFWITMQTDGVYCLQAWNSVQCRGRASWGCARLIMGCQTTLRYWIMIPTNMKLYYWGV